MNKPGAAKFNDGKIRFLNFNETSESCYTDLFETEEDALYSALTTGGCTDRRHFRTSVHIIVKGFGSWWGNACTKCESLTSAVSPNETFTTGEPAWSPWLKKENAKYHVEQIPGFSMSDWLDDYKTEEHYETEKNEHNRSGEFIRNPESGEILRNSETGELARFKEGEFAIHPESGQILRDSKTGKWKLDNNSTTTPVGYDRGLSSDDLPF